MHPQYLINSPGNVLAASVSTEKLGMAVHIYEFKGVVGWISIAHCSQQCQQ